MTDEKLILVNVSGPDQPGITSGLMARLVESKVAIYDIGQAVTHGLLSLSFLIKSNKDPSELSVLKELLFDCKNKNLILEYSEVMASSAIAEYQADKFILSCVSTQKISAAFLKDVSHLFGSNDINIIRIDNVTPPEFKCLEILASIPSSLDMKQVKKELIAISNLHSIDLAFLRDNVYRRSKRLIVFDMDSTLIQTEVIDEMAEVIGVGDEVRAITEKAMNGEMDFDQSLKQRVAKLEGLSLNQMQEILERLPYTQGAQEFISTVKKLGYKVALISGGFSFFANALKEKLGLDYAFANELQVVSGKLTGKIEGQIVNAEQKALLLKLITQQENINLEQVVAIGDGANDLPMLSTAGLGIAYHAKDIVKKEAEQHMSHGPMTTILYFLGIPGPGDH